MIKKTCFLIALIFSFNQSYAESQNEQSFPKLKSSHELANIDHNLKNQILNNTSFKFFVKQEGLEDKFPSGFLELNPQIKAYRLNWNLNEQFLLIDWNSNVSRFYTLIYKNNGHWLDATLENPISDYTEQVQLVDGEIVIKSMQQEHRCNLVSKELSLLLKEPPKVPFTSVCGGALWLKRTSVAYKSSIEGVTDLLRTTGSAGEGAINLYKSLFGKNGESAEQLGSFSGKVQSSLVLSNSKELNKIKISVPNLGISIEENGRKKEDKVLFSGKWYKSFYDKYNARWVSALYPSHYDISGPGANKLVYLMAFDLDKDFLINYGTGVDHPNLKWSGRPKVERVGSGPDGFSDDSIVKRSTMVSPWQSTRSIAVFSGGFKREHSAFRVGERSLKNGGYHYGFAEGGIVRSKIQEGLATIWRSKNGEVNLGVWDESLNKKQSEFGFIRQNGLLLIENNSPTENVKNMLAGNWSGNAQGDIATMRSAFCLAKTLENKKIGIYAVFSLSTPEVMAQTLSALGCKEALQLDMNSPQLTYGAFIYGTNYSYEEKDKKQILYEPLMLSMVEESAMEWGRFVSAPDSRDFFVIYKK